MMLFTAFIKSEVEHSVKVSKKIGGKQLQSVHIIRSKIEHADDSHSPDMMEVNTFDDNHLPNCSEESWTPCYDLSAQKLHMW